MVLLVSMILMVLMVLMISMVLMVPVVTRLMAVVSKLSMFRLSWRWSWWLRWSRWSRWSPGGWRWSFSAAGGWTGWPAWSSRSPTSASWRWPGSLRALRLGLLQTHEPLKWIFSGYRICQWRTNEYSYRWILEQKIFSKQGKAKKRKKICTAKRETSGPGVVERGKIVRTCAMYFLSFDHSTGRWHNLSRYLCNEM